MLSKKRSAMETFKKDKNGFIVCLSVCATIWFLAVCILFGVYIYCSFNSVGVYATQTQEGDFNKQGVAGASITIN